MPHERTLSEVLLNFGDQLKNDMKKCCPATVTAVHPSTTADYAGQTVDVQVATLNVVFDELGTAIQEPPISFANVPLGCLRGGGFLVWLPVTVGDSVLLIFSDLSADSWRAGDGSSQPPGFVGKHTTDSPFALPMFAPDAKVFSSPGANPGNLIIGKDGSSQQIQISASGIALGNPAPSGVCKATLVDPIMTDLSNVVSTLSTVVGALLPTAGPTAIQTAACTAACTAMTALLALTPTTGSTLVTCG